MPATRSPFASLCSPAEHDAIKERVEYFLLETRNHQKWGGVLTGECALCDSTLALDCCTICREPCPTTDALPWGPPADETVAHFECAAAVMVSGKRVGKFVIFVGGGKAREFIREALAGKGLPS